MSRIVAILSPTTAITNKNMREQPHVKGPAFATKTLSPAKKEADAPSQHRSANQKAVKTKKKDEPPRKKKHTTAYTNQKTALFSPTNNTCRTVCRTKKRSVSSPKQLLSQNIQYICETGQKLLIFCVTFCPEKFGRKAANFSMKISRRKRQILFLGWILGCDRPP